MHLGQNCGSLVEYLKAFDVTLRVMQTEESLRRIAYELAEDAARENVRYMEVRYAPMLHTRRGLKLTTVVESVLEGLRAGAGQARHRVERSNTSAARWRRAARRLCRSIRHNLWRLAKPGPRPR